MSSTFEYIIQPEDTLWDLADDLDVSVEDIMDVNANLDPNQLYAGQAINLPVDASQRPGGGRPGGGRPGGGRPGEGRPGGFERRPEFGRERFRRPYEFGRRPYYPYYPYPPYYPYNPYYPYY